LWKVRRSRKQQAYERKKSLQIFTFLSSMQGVLISTGRGTHILRWRGLELGTPVGSCMAGRLTWQPRCWLVPAGHRSQAVTTV
jgi:hypothetical protein